jgi:ATP-binding cassette subfamily F protein uup
LIIRDFSFILQRGDKLGIVGPNGSGKTTLVNLLIGNLKPLKGSIQFGTNLDWVYFDQLRSQLDENQTLYENVAQGRDTITINGQNRNVYGYLEDFLFTKERVHAPIQMLSGGERNRLLLARLFTMPANLLILDEPTNDLDLETLELLENLLLDFKGTFILVSHDRAFLNNLVTSTLVLEGDGLVREYIGGYDDWHQLSQEKMNNTIIDKDKTNSTNKNLKTSEIGTPKKLNFMQKKKLQEELDQLPGKIELLESEYQNTIKKMSSSEFYNQEEKAFTETASRLKWLADEIAHTYQRWQDVEHLLTDNEN